MRIWNVGINKTISQRKEYFCYLNKFLSNWMCIYLFKSKNLLKTRKQIRLSKILSHWISTSLVKLAHVNIFCICSATSSFFLVGTSALAGSARPDSRNVHCAEQLSLKKFASTKLPYFSSIFPCKSVNTLFGVRLRCDRWHTSIQFRTAMSFYSSS